MLKNGLTLTLWMLLLVAAAGCDTPTSGGSGGGGQQAQTQLLGPQPPYTPEPVVGSFMFVIDRSADSGIVDAGATHTRLDRAVAHARRVLAALVFTATEQSYFDVMSFGGAPTTHRLFGTLTPATTQNLAIADTYLTQLQPGGPSPQYTALMTACLGTRAFLSRMYFYSASLPGADPNAPGGVATPANILAAIPTWFSGFQDASLHCVRVGAVPDPHTSWMQNLAAMVGGTYLAI